MRTDTVAARSTGSPVLENVTALSGLEDAQPEAGQFIIPDNVVLFSSFSSVHDALREFWHGKSHLSDRPRRKRCVSSRAEIAACVRIETSVARFRKTMSFNALSYKDVLYRLFRIGASKSSEAEGHRFESCRVRHLAFLTADLG